MWVRKKLTQKDIDSAKPAEREYGLWDAILPGFGLRVRPSGAKAFVFLYRQGRKQRRVTIGTPFVHSLEQARRKAREHAHEASLGFDPAAAKAKARNTTLETVYSAYADSRMPLFSAGHRVRVQGIFKAEIIPKLGQKPIGLVSRSDIREITDKKIAGGKKAMANNVHRAMSAFLTWCVADAEFMEVNPLHGSRLPCRHRSRDRYLSKEELVTIWRTCAHLDDRWRPAIRLMMLTGQRKGEVLGARVGEFNLPARIWIIPAERSKNRCAQTVFLSAAAVAAIKEVPRFDGQQYLFQSYLTDQPRPIAETYSSVRKLLSLLPFGGWHLHDLRRSVATHMAQLKVAPHVIQVILNHRSGIRSGVTAIYNRYSYCEEAREAWNLWGATLEEWSADPAVIFIPSIKEEEVVEI